MNQPQPKRTYRPINMALYRSIWPPSAFPSVYLPKHKPSIYQSTNVLNYPTVLHPPTFPSQFPLWAEFPTLIRLRPDHPDGRTVSCCLSLTLMCFLYARCCTRVSSGQISRCFSGKDYRRQTRRADEDKMASGARSKTERALKVSRSITDMSWRNESSYLERKQKEI
jgi:hypothetical protein